ncbi:YcjF family protein [Ovoidimarina sediminis]|uniref:YcjF family protein n=1 Tax=Ovoidimarina sediminis TaxID=3079856 RepID=UPI00290CF0F5|nr:TIGR01620 family protein [Rhodophyticola sp. MJ-SS7]MDU8942758.1 TIGR01620 family protein [Rhodophyticola sp. MJ-SS7]
MTDPRNGPVLIETEDTGPSPAAAPPVLDAPAPEGAAMQAAAGFAARKPSALARWFWRLLGAIVTFGLSLWAWDFVTGLIARNAVLGYVALALLGLFLAVCLAIILREWAALARLARLDSLHHDADAARAAGDLMAARGVAQRVRKLYAGRPDMTWAEARLTEDTGEILDADTLFDHVERTLLAPLDARARVEIEGAARQVATVTALVPIALADVVAALTANLRMIRRIAEIYGGRGGTLGAWRLTRAVFAHLVATGAVAVGDDLLGSVGGGHLLSKLSRRFGEGLVNGALTARVGIAAMEVCRPLPFHAERRPSVTRVVQRALTGLFATGEAGPR